MVKRERQIANTSQYGKERYCTYTDVIKRYHQALANGYYLEAITLMESIISDRLESYLIRMTSDNKYSFNTLGQLIQGLTCIGDTHMPISDILIWKNNRNASLHEMAKIEDGKYRDFGTKYSDAKNCADEGYELFRKIDAICRK